MWENLLYSSYHSTSGTRLQHKWIIHAVIQCTRGQQTGDDEKVTSNLSLCYCRRMFHWQWWRSTYCVELDAKPDSTSPIDGWASSAKIMGPERAPEGPRIDASGTVHRMSQRGTDTSDRIYNFLPLSTTIFSLCIYLSFLCLLFAVLGK